MRRFLTLLTLSLGMQLNAQSDYAQYYLLSHQARAAMKARQPDSAWTLYTRAFSLVDTPLAPELHAARDVAHHIRKCCPLQYTTIIYQARIYDSIADEQDKGYDRNYSAFIEELIKDDQRVRSKKYSLAMPAWKACLKDPGCDKTTEAFKKNERLALEWRRVDSVNIHRLLQRIPQSGFPSSRRVGGESSIAACMMLLHFDRDSLNAVLGPIISSALANGEIQPEFYAHIVDRRLRGGQGKDPYYYQIPVHEGLQDPQKLAEINRRRASIGLPSIAESFTLTSYGAKSK